MKYPTRLSDAVHILAFIALYPDCDLTSNKLAESIQTNPAYVRQLMSALRKGGLLISVKGHPRPALAREPEKITLLDAYRAVEPLHLSEMPCGRSRWKTSGRMPCVPERSPFRGQRPEPQHRS